MSRTQLHEDIAKLLQVKMQENNIECQWIADANGVRCKITTENDEEAEKIFQQIFTVLGEAGSSDQLNLVSKVPRAYGADYKPAAIINVLEKIGEPQKAKEYRDKISEENQQVALKLSELMKENKVQWEASIDGVFCTHIQQVSTTDYDNQGREAGKEAFEDTLKKFRDHLPEEDRIPWPHIEAELGINARNDFQIGKVKVDAGYNSGEALEHLNERLDKALLAKQTQASTSKTDEVLSQKQGGGTFSDKKNAATEYRANIKECKTQNSSIAEKQQICQKISEFCSQYPEVKGIQEMGKIIGVSEWNRETADTRLTKLIELAQWKKSDNFITEAFHKGVRGRDPQVEAFYQRLAALDPNDKEQVNKFMEYLDETLGKEQSQQFNM
ncbi:hypothetical protein [Legionella cherrii]|uniref:Substrate of the Dot/Icm secretion system n=1 Tax=Legionella cherrii TaxID=28084 RepID=A0ABY6T925_9GAMM|nr:hypothetical protein [Legionella cherrii]VEB38046.1 Uncharacterised protein [Legionella cherrii]